nr:uracil-DNA glycosylase family protein [Deinococcus sp. YIM 77859]
MARPTVSAAELSRSELRAGVPHLRRLVARYRIPLVAYTGKGVYLAATGKSQAPWGMQDGSLTGDAPDVVLPSPSGLARLPFAEKLRYYRALAERLQRPPG